jgi:hypothetical protein
MQTITRDTSVGIYDNCTDIARIYPDRTVATLAGVRWVGNTGGYHVYRHRIDGEAHQRILAAMASDADETAWEIIYAATRGY